MGFMRGASAAHFTISWYFLLLALIVVAGEVELSLKEYSPLSSSSVASEYFLDDEPRTIIPPIKHKLSREWKPLSLESLEIPLINKEEKNDLRYTRTLKEEEAALGPPPSNETLPEEASDEYAVALGAIAEKAPHVTPRTARRYPRSYLVKLNRVHALQKGAVCLDGTPAAYYFRKGYGSGAANWLFYFQGGGWCFTVAECYRRSKSSLGSSRFLPASADFSGILSADPHVNPDFYNWNLMYLQSCDGGMFAGNRGTPLSNGQGKYVRFRGKAVSDALLTEALYTHGMINAKEVLVGGESAGGLAAMMQSDKIRSKFARNAHPPRVKCMSDAGYFLDLQDVRGCMSMRKRFQALWSMQSPRDGVHQRCPSIKSKQKAWQCLFPQYFVAQIETPLFVVNSLYDTIQLTNSLVPIGVFGASSRGLVKIWSACLPWALRCSHGQLSTLQEFRYMMIGQLSHVLARQQNGVFAYSCFAHTWAFTDAHWKVTPTVRGKSMSQALGAWYFGRGGVSASSFDCAYPCNSCGGKVG